MFSTNEIDIVITRINGFKRRVQIASSARNCYPAIVAAEASKTRPQIELESGVS